MYRNGPKDDRGENGLAVWIMMGHVPLSDDSCRACARGFSRRGIVFCNTAMKWVPAIYCFDIWIVHAAFWKSREGNDELAPGSLAGNTCLFATHGGTVISLNDGYAGHRPSDNTHAI